MTARNILMSFVWLAILGGLVLLGARLIGYSARKVTV